MNMYSSAESFIDRLPSAFMANLPYAEELQLKRVELFVIPAIALDGPGYRICMRLTTAIGYGWSEIFIEKKEKPSDWVLWSSSLVHCINSGETRDNVYPIDKRLGQMLRSALEQIGTGLNDGTGQESGSEPASAKSEAAAQPLQSLKDAPLILNSTADGLTVQAPDAAEAGLVHNAAYAMAGAASHAHAGSRHESGSAEAGIMEPSYAEAANMIAAASVPEDASAGQAAVPSGSARPDMQTAVSDGLKRSMGQHSEDIALLSRSECYISLF